MYPTRHRQEENGRKRLIDQEMKCGTMFWQEGTKVWHKRVLSSRKEPDRFGVESVETGGAVRHAPGRRGDLYS